MKHYFLPFGVGAIEIHSLSTVELSASPSCRVRPLCVAKDSGWTPIEAMSLWCLGFCVGAKEQIAVPAPLHYLTDSMLEGLVRFDTAEPNEPINMFLQNRSHQTIRLRLLILCEKDPPP